MKVSIASLFIYKAASKGAVSPFRKAVEMARTDRAPGHRGAYEKNRAKILATQEVCAICGKPVDKTLKSPHPLSATVDHIIPVSKGGHPSDLANLQLAHRCCNREKSDKILKETGREPVDAVISNRVLPLAADWLSYVAK